MVFATAEGTRRRAERSGRPPTAYTVLGRTGLHASRIGFGSYRVDDRQPAQAEALARALGAGCNLVDTSTNYTDGGSERRVGSTLRALAATGTLVRDEVIVVSKVGYMQGQNLALAVERRRSGRPFPETVEYMERCWHCIHADFIADQLGRSLERLAIERVDVYLLHNPEYFLSDAHRRDFGHLPYLRDRFYDRIKRAFAHLETEVARGRISWYGVSSNSLAAPLGDPDATSLGRMWELAVEVAGDAHHFAVAQFPANLLEGGHRLVRDANGDTVLDVAARHDLGVLVNRPLNAIRDEQLMRLSDGGGRNDEAHAYLDRFLPPDTHGATLSQKAIAALMNTAGVHTVLCGMRRPEYVDDALAVLDWPPFVVTDELYQAFT